MAKPPFGSRLTLCRTAFTRRRSSARIAYAHVSLQVCKPLSMEVIMKGFSWRVALAGAALLATSAAFPSVSHADTFTILTDNIGVNCSPSCGTVTVTDNGNNTYTFDVDLAPNTLVLHTTPGNPSTVAFNLAGVTAL